MNLDKKISWFLLTGDNLLIIVCFFILNIFSICVFCFEGASSSSGLVAFLSGLLLGGDTKARNWFSSFVRIGQKVN